MTSITRTTQHGKLAIDFARKHHTIAVVRQESILQLMKGLEILCPCHTNRWSMITIAPGDIILFAYFAHTRVVTITPLSYLRIITLEMDGVLINVPNLYGSLIFETNFTHQHNLSVGLSVNHDYLGQRANVNVSPRPTVGQEDSPYLLSEMQRMNEKETTPGAYAQYTYTLGTKLTAMAGVRFDHRVRMATKNFLIMRAVLLYIILISISNVL